MIITPSAKQFLAERGIELIIRNKEDDVKREEKKEMNDDKKKLL
ncbi:hypothetical protein [Caloramator sp. Dgby_cultured_2]|nr:hypothetical protein [Caloramator sp. Dgby_cultured_2]WDU82156.1 hypothetical protein PWK10_10385 [Caloramator sp. Dgby_cultured_2]